MLSNPTAECLRRSAWYRNHIRALQRQMTRKSNLDGDDVEQCHSMLREIRARFRADQRTPPAGHILSHVELNFRAALAQASEALRIPMGSRPAGRWRQLLAECEARIEAFDARYSPPLGT
jgi:hypothetical protein